MPNFEQLWRDGFRGYHIEECIDSTFLDLPPYAGADRKLLTFTRRSHPTGFSDPLAPTSSSSLVVEEDNNFTISMQDSQAGRIAFSTTGALSIDAALRVPLPPSWPQASAEMTAAPKDPEIAAKGKRIGQLEANFAYPDPHKEQQSCGIRLGPSSLRLTRTPRSIAATERRQDSSSSPANSTDSLENKEGRAFAYTIDAAWCLPLGVLSTGSKAVSSTAVAGSATEAVSPTMRAEPWLLTCAVQVPLSVGDTVVGVLLENRRAVATSGNGSRGAVGTPQWDMMTTAAAAPAAGGGATEGLLYHASNDTAKTTKVTATYRILLMQTIARHSLVEEAMSDLDESRNTSSTAASRRHRRARGGFSTTSTDWRALPTLVCANIGFFHDRFRLSAASNFHGSRVELETAAALDLNLWVPMSVKLGWNNAGRVAVGISSLYFDSLSVALGVFVGQGDRAKFGLAVSF